MVARLDNQPTHEVVDRALVALDNLEHRGAEGADIRTGDGAGILVQMPDAFFRARRRLRAAAAGRLRRRRVLPAARRRAPRRKLEQLLELNVRVEGQRVLGWRDVPVDEEHVGDTANALAPAHPPAVHRRRPGLRGPTRTRSSASST